MQNTKKEHVLYYFAFSRKGTVFIKHRLNIRKLREMGNKIIVIRRLTIMQYSYTMCWTKRELKK